jgi:hypothetical protein
MSIKRIIECSLGAIVIIFFLWLFVACWISTDDRDRTTASPKNPMKAILSCEFAMTETAEALRYFWGGQARAKVVITID